jgi:hypothetical protein
LGQLVFNEWVKKHRQGGTTETDGIQQATASGTVPNTPTSPRKRNAREWDSANEATASNVGKKME